MEEVQISPAQAKTSFFPSGVMLEVDGSWIVSIAVVEPTRARDKAAKTRSPTLPDFAKVFNSVEG